MSQSTGLRGRRNSLLAGAALVLTALLLVACGGKESAAPGKVEAGSLEDLIAAAKQEGTLTMYSGVGEDVLKLEVEAFSKEYGIDATYVRTDLASLNERIKTEAETNVNFADVYQTTTTEPFVRDNAQLFVQLDEDQIPGWDDYPEIARKERLFYIIENPSVITYNTDLVPGGMVPSTWSDMTDAFWKGKILVTDPTYSPSYMGWAQVMIDEYGVQYLKDLKSQDFELGSSGPTSAQQVAAGTAYAYFPGRNTSSVELKAQGAPIKSVVVPGTGSDVMVAVLDKAPHPNAARLFAHFLMTRELHQKLCGALDGALSFYGIDGQSDPVSGCADPGDGWQLRDYEVSEEQRATILNALGLS